jgi:hypothetical protein
MCLTVNKYATTIQKISTEVYPVLQQQLDKLFYTRTKQVDNIFSQKIADLHNQFSSLTKYELKLIFPAVLSVFKKTDLQQQFHPNTSEILSLTRSKEEKIENLLFSLEDLITAQKNNPDLDTETATNIAALEILIQSFNKAFFPIKKNWNQLMLELTPARVNCKNRETNVCKCSSKAIEKVYKKNQNMPVN